MVGEDEVGSVDFENVLEHWKEFLVSVSDFRMYSVFSVVLMPLGITRKGKKKCK